MEGARAVDAPGGCLGGRRRKTRIVRSIRSRHRRRRVPLARLVVLLGYSGLVAEVAFDQELVGLLVRLRLLRAAVVLEPAAETGALREVLLGTERRRRLQKDARVHERRREQERVLRIRGG